LPKRGESVERRVSVVDDWEQAWCEAGEILEAARSWGLTGVRVTVKAVVLPARKRRGRNAWGIFVITPEPEPEDDQEELS
jgi:hypothetical protein